MMRKIKKLLGLSTAEQILLLHSAVLLILSTIGLRFFPWLKIQRLFLDVASRHPYRSGSSRPSVQKIHWTLRAASHRIPKATCLPQALAAQYLLVRNGYPAELQIGVAKRSSGKLEAHAWVITENQFLVGDVRNSDRFVPLSNPGGLTIGMFRTDKRTTEAGWTSEARLLVLCSRTRITPDLSAQILELVQREIDWDLLVRMAFDHQVAPLVYRTLESVAPSVVPASVKAELKQQIQVFIQGNLSLTHELIQVVRLLDQHNIPSIPYKGPVLAASIYHDLSIRSFGDLDILVREEDVLRTMDILLADGYEIIRPNRVARTEADFQSYWIRRLVQKASWGYQIVLWNPARQGIVELHWRVAPRYVFSKNPEQLWEDLQAVSLAGSTLQTLAPENLLWYLCLHGSKHKWTELRWVCDVAELLREHSDLDWNLVCARAAELGLERRLYLGLSLCRKIMGTPLPAIVEDRIESMPSVERLAAEVMERLFIPSRGKSVPAKIRRLTFQLRTMDHLQDRVRYFTRFFKRLDSMMTARRRRLRPFSFLSLSSR